MKFLMFCLFVFISSAKSETQTLDEAFKKEFGYLALQKEVLFRQKSLSSQKHDAAKNNLENQIKVLEQKNALQVFEIEVLSEKVARLEKKKREAYQKIDSLESVYKKARNSLVELKSELNFEKKASAAKWETSDIKIKDFDPIIEQSFALLHSASSIQSADSYYLNLEGDLVKTTLLRYGRIGAQLIEEGKSRLLGPSSQGILKDLGLVAELGPIRSLVIFENLTDKIELKQSANMWDKLADKLPLIVLIFIFLIVMGLFTLFAKD